MGDWKKREEYVKVIAGDDARWEYGGKCEGCRAEIWFIRHGRHWGCQVLHARSCDRVSDHKNIKLAERQ